MTNRAAVSTYSTLIKRNCILSLFMLVVGCSASGSDPAPWAPPAQPEPTTYKTFSTLTDKSVFVLGGHGAYTKFTDKDFKVLKVTNLNRSGEGSLDWAVRQTGVRIVVFEVGGIIDLNGANINIVNPYIYIAAQSAPAPGIIIIKGGVSIQGHDVVISHLSVRPGDRGLTSATSWDCDAMATYAAYNVVIDHCSLSWGTDENLSASGPRHEGEDKTSRSITFSNNIIAECLSNSIHSQGEHSKGSLIHDYCSDIAIVGNLYASNLERNPLLKPNAKAYIANNLIYNPLRRAIHAAWSEDEYKDYPGTIGRAKAAVIGNILVPGPDTPSGFWFIFGKMDVYHRDNVILARATDSNGDRTSRIISTETGTLTSNPMSAAVYTAALSTTVASSICGNAGSRPGQRDAIDARVVSNILTGTGKVIDSQSEVGGYPSYTLTHRNLNVPTTDIEEWLNRLETELLMKQDKI